MCLNVPLFHIYGLLTGQMNMLNTGCAIVLESPSFNPTKSVEMLTREKCTLMCGTPTMWVSRDNERPNLPRI
jgi:fatty-acyl-CoA synthase